MRKVYRLSFDFWELDDLIDFWKSFQATNRGPSTSANNLSTWNTCGPCYKDTLHDQGKSVQEFLIREASIDNGRPLELN
jgi:hypothetical protein